ncbi:hypothetical protein WDW37_06685, partial [Bdellovibrionota bacterium FG-1]
MSKIDQNPGIRDLEGILSIFGNRRLSCKIARHCLDYSRLHCYHPEQADGKKFFDDFPSSEVKTVALAIEDQFRNLILGERVHGVPLGELNDRRWQEHWRFIAWLVIDTISERFFLELDGLGISELPTLHEYTSFSQKAAHEELRSDILEKLNGALRVAKTRSKEGVECRIKNDTILSKLDSNKESNIHAKLALELCSYGPASARVFGISVIMLKLLHQMFSESKLFNNPKAAATDFCNCLHFFSRLPVPDSNPVDAYASSNFDSMIHDSSGTQWTYPMKKSWLNQHHKYKKHFMDTFAEGTLFAPMKSNSTLTLEKHLSNAAAFTCALGLLRCGFNGHGHTEK